MSEENNSIHVNDDAIIRRILTRSKLARKILYSLSKGDKYMSEIARDINSDSSNCMFCIFGNNFRYSGSLLETGLVFCYEYKENKYYGITQKGREWLQKLPSVDKNAKNKTYIIENNMIDGE